MTTIVAFGLGMIIGGVAGVLILSVLTIDGE